MATEEKMSVSDEKEDLKKETLDQEESILQELMNATFAEEVDPETCLSTVAPNVQDNPFDIKEESEFDAFTDGVTIHKKYQLRRKPKTIKETEDKYSPVKRSNEYDDKYYPCKNCRKTFDTKTGLLNHMRMHQTIKSFTCGLCQETFDTNVLLIEHKAVHDKEDRVFLCKMCQMAYTDHCDFLIHEITHMQRSTYKCIECDSYQNPKYIKRHIESHFDRKIKCSECDNVYKSIYNLNSHFAKDHVKMNQVECVECGKMFKTNSSYQLHLSVHTGVKKYQCYYCGQGFSHKGGRLVHMRIHTNTRPYECDMCPRKFFQQTDLNRHKLRHGERIKLECDVCGKKYSDKSTLRQHTKLHRQENIYYCPVCSKPCQTRMCLKIHMIYKHTTSKPFKCEICEIAFKDSKGLVRHNKSKAHKRQMFGVQKKKLET